MILRSVAVVLLLQATAVAAVATDLPGQWREWHYSRQISVSNASGPVKVSIPPDVYAHLENGLPDLRVLDDLGSEIPFILYDENVRAPVEARPATIRENSFLPGKYTQLVVDLGGRTGFHNAIEIQTSETDFINWVEIAASDDTTTWRIVKDRAPISGFRKENVAGSRLVRYSDNNARYLRVRLFETAHQFPISSVKVFFSRETQEPSRVILPSQFTLDSSAPSSVSRWGTDLGAGSFPVSGVAIDPPQSQFFRIIRMQASDNGKDWQDYCSGQIYRYKQGDKLAESLRVYSQEIWNHRFWRIEIVNGSDSPLAGATPTLLIIPRFLLFFPQANRSYRLIYGNIRAKSPTYDLARTFDYRTAPTAPLAGAGAEASTSNYLDPRPLTERYPHLLWVALGIAAVALAYAALRALRTKNVDAT
jgi:hypothetical protein